MYRFLILCGLLGAMLAACRNNADRNDGGDDMNSPFIDYCRSIDVTDTLSLHDEMAMGKNVAGIIKMMEGVDSIEIRKGLSIFFNSLKNDAAALTIAMGCANKLLNSPDSPVRNQKAYADFLQTLAMTDSLPDYVKAVVGERLRIALLNSPGTIASDLKFQDRNGELRSLQSLASQLGDVAKLLVFYDPDCRHCSEIIGKLAADPQISSAVDEGRLVIVAIYAEGDRSLWDRTKADMPSSWIVGYDLSSVVENDIYDLSAMPVIYLLDGTNRVVLKEPTPIELLSDGILN